VTADQHHLSAHRHVDPEEEILKKLVAPSVTLSTAVDVEAAIDPSDHKSHKYQRMETLSSTRRLTAKIACKTADSGNSSTEQQ